MLHPDFKVFRAAALSTLLLIACNAWSAGYWDLELPVMDGASAIAPSRNEDLSVISLTFELEIQDPVEIRKFYDEYFKGLGWKNELQIRPRSFVGGEDSLGGWSGNQMTFTSDGEPLVVYVANWEPDDIPATAVLNVRLTGHSQDQFSSEVSVQIGPNPVPQILFRLRDLLATHPENLFKLHEAAGGNPLEIHNFDIDNIPPRLEADPVVVEYISIVEELREANSEFHQRYNQ